MHNRRHHAAPTRGEEEFWPWNSVSSMTALCGDGWKRQNLKPTLSAAPGTWAPTSSSSPIAAVTRHRRSYGQHGHDSGGLHHYHHHHCCCRGKSSTAYGLGSLHLQRQFSEDSGFSSCSSSASSIADDFEAPPCHTRSVRKVSAWSTRTYNWSAPSSGCSAQSGTVASVLAAGVSDSEETDHCETDEEETDNIFKIHGMKLSANQSDNRRNLHLPTPSAILVASQVHIVANKASKQEKLQLHHLKRDILDLATNLRTNFPLRATELPDRNLPLFLQNRSQYHRLGKFGTTETHTFANCKKQCGFSFPVPPRDMASCATN